MECNRDEAIRAKFIAESKLAKSDFSGARKFAVKAQTLYPGLDGVPQLLMMLGVYVASENTIGGEIDWYGVLGVNPLDDDEIIRKQYRKLALVLHPDKNKSPGADGAFRLISEAWGLLSDKAKRLAYNQRRGVKGFQQKGQTHTAGSSSGNGNVPVPKTQKNTAKGSKPPNIAPRNDTFWTLCHGCKMHYEYLIMYLNQSLKCPNCHGAFMAYEHIPSRAPPVNDPELNEVPRQRPKTTPLQIPSQNARDVSAAQKSGQVQPGTNSFSHYEQNPQSVPAGVGSSDPTIATKAANVVQQTQEKLKKAYAEAHAPSRMEESVRKRKLENAVAHGTATGSAAGSRNHGSSATSRKPDSTRDLTPMETRQMLITKAQTELRKYLSTQADLETTKKEDGTKKSNQERCKTERKGDSSNLSAAKEGDRRGKGQLTLSADNASNEDHEDAPISVPDPDFHDFDQDRTENSFGDNEVWAAYDNDDGMPRFYALISKVISTKPFKLKISWLNSKTNSEFSTLDWIGSGFYKTSGEFRIGKYEICKSINAFSGKMNCSKGPRGAILIFPQKGDVWALYKNWSPDWSENTPDEVVHKYEMAIVLDNYNQNQGISVSPLEKVVGFKTVFRPNMDQNAVKVIPKEEMFRFSHRVPHHILTGQEAQNAPKGCLELDPAATSPELLQVTTKGNEAPPSVPDPANRNEGPIPNIPTVGLGEANTP